MSTSNPKKTAILRALAAVVVVLALPLGARGEAVGVDPAATRILQRMTDYLGGLQHFSVHTQNTLEDVLASGQRVDMDITASVTVSRPDKLRAERKGDLMDQVFYYDGKDLTLYNPSDKVYATLAAPPTIDRMLDFTRESLGLGIPAADLLYSHSYALLTKGLTSGVLVGKAMIDGVKCDHLAFSRPGVDFQVWVADGQQPLPRKYVVTDTATPGRLSISTLMRDWAVKPDSTHAGFTFAPPKGAKAIDFMRLDASRASGH